ncbi:surfeit locus protein 1 [Cylas formicarius]|uniref:surfeit locus protein 1 n=1 Tax=Cylas formicarius TaxID=197179 RepID=UPI00295854D8|nr:surfeit locus protein 1 [Cylas formicarius]
MNFSRKLVTLYGRRWVLRSFSIKKAPEQRSKPGPLTKLGQIEPVGWFLLVIPAASLSLGVWQIRRKRWKAELIDELKEKTLTEPVPLPFDEEDVKRLEFRPVRVRGTFLHDAEIYLGPRTLLSGGEASTQSSLISSSAAQGYLVITPFRLADREETILVNRGWVPSKNRDPRTRSRGQIEGVVDVVGIVRSHENRPPFAVKNRPGSGVFFYRDLKAMSAATGSSPVFLDATRDSDVDGGPIGGQTRVALRDEHTSYIITWFSLAAFTGYMWYRRFVMK